MRSREACPAALFESNKKRMLRFSLKDHLPFDHSWVSCGFAKNRPRGQTPRERLIRLSDYFANRHTLLMISFEKFGRIAVSLG